MIASPFRTMQPDKKMNLSGASNLLLYVARELKQQL